MANFNFSSLAETNFVSNSKRYLRPYNIYKVQLSKIERSTINGTKVAGSTYPVVALEFTGEDGVFTTNLFIPDENRAEDFAQNENPNTHKKQPSNWDRFYMTILQILEVLNPDASAKFKELAKQGKINSVDTFLKVTLPAISSSMSQVNEIYLKLVGRNNNGTVYATLPTSCWLDATDGRVKPLNFISRDEKALNFSSYETQQAKAYNEAKPTDMSVNPDTKDDLDDDLLDSLL